MIEREKIDILVKKMVDKNKLQKCFIPIIEEFFFRVADQLEWKDEELNNAISRYEKVVNIKFVNMFERVSLFKKYKKHEARTIYNYNTKKILVYFDMEYLKSILEFDKEKIEKFINHTMHEQGHVIQIEEKENKFNFGFEEIKEVKEIGGNEYTFKDCIIDEFVEVINAARLQNGNIERDKYYGYEEIQTAGKIILNSFGISKLELANLQFEPNSREAYESLIANKLRSVPSEIYRDSFGKILDAIYNFSNDENQRDNLILQIDSLQILSKKIFEDRFNDIMINSNNTLRDLARLSIDQEEKSNELMILFDEFDIKDSELQINDGRDIHTMLSEQGYNDEYLEEFYNIECEEKIRNQEQTNKQNEKYYDNEELIEKLYQSFFKYPIREVPLKDRAGVILSKIIGKIKRKTLEQNNLLPESNIYNYNRHTKFVNRISNLEEYKESEVKGQENNRIEFQEERDNSNENSR